MEDFFLKLGTSWVMFVGYEGHKHSPIANIVISYSTWTHVIKKWANFSSKVVPIGLDFLVVKGMTMVAMQWFKISYIIILIKNNWNWICAITPVANFLSSCQWHDPASSYLINKLVVMSELKVQWIDKNPIAFFNQKKHMKPYWDLIHSSSELWLRRNESIEGEIKLK